LVAEFTLSEAEVLPQNDIGVKSYNLQMVAKAGKMDSTDDTLEGFDNKRGLKT